MPDRVLPSRWPNASRALAVTGCESCSETDAGPPRGPAVIARGFAARCGDSPNVTYTRPREPARTPPRAATGAGPDRLPRRRRDRVRRRGVAAHGRPPRSRWLPSRAQRLPRWRSRRSRCRTTRRSSSSATRGRTDRPRPIPTLGYAYVLGESEGWDTIVDGVRGSGYLKPGIDGGSYGERIAQLDPALDPDLVIVEGSINDRRLYPTGYRDAVTAAWDALAALYPEASFVIMGPAPQVLPVREGDGAHRRRPRRARRGARLVVRLPHRRRLDHPGQLRLGHRLVRHRPRPSLDRRPRLPGRAPRRGARRDDRREHRHRRRRLTFSDARWRDPDVPRNARRCGGNAEGRPLRNGLRLCAPDWNRTSDLWYRKPTLYPLSYGGVPIEGITATGADLRASALRRARQQTSDEEPLECEEHDERREDRQERSRGLQIPLVAPCARERRERLGHRQR